MGRRVSPRAWMRIRGREGRGNVRGEEEVEATRDDEAGDREELG